MARKATTYKDVLEIMTYQTVVPCFRCGVPFTPKDVRVKPSAPNAIQKEHIHELALGGEDVPDNCRFSHKACHDIITNGTKATKKNSSKSRIADTKKKEKARLEEEALTPSQKILRDAEIKAAPFAKPKMKGRGFQKGPKRKIQNRKDFK